MTDAPNRIWAWQWLLPYPSAQNGKTTWSSVAYPEEQDVAQYILATPEALATSPEVAKLVAEAEARGMERAMPTDRAIQDLSDHMWRVHPRELDEGGYVSKRFGGKYENPLAAWYADQIKALCRGSAIRAEAAAIRRAAEETGK